MFRLFTMVNVTRKVRESKVDSREWHVDLIAFKALFYFLNSTFHILV